MEARSWVARRRRLCHPLRDESDKVFVMLQAYMDDSGSHDRAPVCTLAGYFGGWRRWGEFEASWGATLKKYGVCEFHAKRFWKRDKEGRRLDCYKDWSDDRANEFIDELLTVIEKSTRINPFACGIHATEWDKQTISDRRMFTGASDE